MIRGDIYRKGDMVRYLDKTSDGVIMYIYNNEHSKPQIFEKLGPPDEAYQSVQETLKVQGFLYDGRVSDKSDDDPSSVPIPYQPTQNVHWGCEVDVNELLAFIRSNLRTLNDAGLVVELLEIQSGIYHLNINSFQIVISKVVKTNAINITTGIGRGVVPLDCVDAVIVLIFLARNGFDFSFSSRDGTKINPLIDNAILGVPLTSTQMDAVASIGIGMPFTKVDADPFSF